MSSPEALQEIVGADTAQRAKDRKSAKKKALAARILITFAALAIWFWTQSLLGARISPTQGIGDVLHRLTAPLNAYLHGAPREANALLIASSALIDAIAIFLLSSWIFAAKVRPFLGLGMLLVTRQDAGVVLSARAARNPLARSRISVAVGDVRGGERFFLQRAHGDCRVWRNRAGAIAASLADGAGHLRGAVRSCRSLGFASALHHGCVHWSARSGVRSASMRRHL